LYAVSLDAATPGEVQIRVRVKVKKRHIALLVGVS
jgi:hypothetical protein